MNNLNKYLRKRLKEKSKRKNKVEVVLELVFQDSLLHLIVCKRLNKCN